MLQVRKMRTNWVNSPERANLVNDVKNKQAANGLTRGGALGRCAVTDAARRRHPMPTQPGERAARGRADCGASSCKAGALSASALEATQ